MVSISLSWHLHYLGVPTATEASPFAKAFQGLSVKTLPRCQTQDSFHNLSILKLSCLPNQYHLGNSYTLPSLAANFRCSPSPLRHRFYVPALKKHVPLHRFHPSNAKLFLITANNHIQVLKPKYHPNSQHRILASLCNFTNQVSVV